MKKSLPLIAATLLILGTSAASARPFYYENERYGTSATFPTEAFPDQLPAPTLGDGRGWTSPRGGELFIYARENSSGAETPKSVISDRAADDAVTYSRSGRRWAVVSGYRDGKIFYERYIFRGNMIHSVSIRYPKAMRGAYDPLVKSITMSLRGGAAHGMTD